MIRKRKKERIAERSGPMARNRSPGEKAIERTFDPVDDSIDSVDSAVGYDVEELIV